MFEQALEKRTNIQTGEVACAKPKAQSKYPYSIIYAKFNLTIPRRLLQGETRVCGSKGSFASDTLRLAGGRFINNIERGG